MFCLTLPRTSDWEKLLWELCRPLVAPKNAGSELRWLSRYRNECEESSNFNTQKEVKHGMYPSIAVMWSLTTRCYLGCDIAESSEVILSHVGLKAARWPSGNHQGKLDIPWPVGKWTLVVAEWNQSQRMLHGRFPRIVLLVASRPPVVCF